MPARDLLREQLLELAADQRDLDLQLELDDLAGARTRRARSVIVPFTSDGLPGASMRSVPPVESAHSSRWIARVDVAGEGPRERWQVVGALLLVDRQREAVAVALERHVGRDHVLRRAGGLAERRVGQHREDRAGERRRSARVGTSCGHSLLPMSENFVSFGEQGAQLTYGSYLRLPQLLDSQHLESDPPAHDELLFITIHQVYELWFKQLLHEVSAARDAMLGGAAGGRLWWAQHLLARVHVIERVLVQQVDVLETMTPQDFLEFRQRLAPASGFQSVQFRELEFLSGAKDPSYLSRFKGITAAEQQHLDARLAEPTLWDAFVAVLGSFGLAGRVATRRSRPRCAPSPTTATSTPSSGRSPRRCSSTTSWPRAGGRGTS